MPNTTKRGPRSPRKANAAAKAALARCNITPDWGRAAKEWKEAMNQFAIIYEDRFPRPAASHETRLSHRAGRLSQATSAVVEKSQPASHTKILTPHFCKEIP